MLNILNSAVRVLPWIKFNTKDDCTNTIRVLLEVPDGEPVITRLKQLGLHHRTDPTLKERRWALSRLLDSRERVSWKINYIHFSNASLGQVFVKRDEESQLLCCKINRDYAKIISIPARLNGIVTWAYVDNGASFWVNPNEVIEIKQSSGLLPSEIVG